MPFPARFPGKCTTCGGAIGRGDLIQWSRKHRGSVWHAACTSPFDGPRLNTPIVDVDKLKWEHSKTVEPSPDDNGQALTPPPSINVPDEEQPEPIDPQASAALDVLADALKSRIPPIMSEKAIRSAIAEGVKDAKAGLQKSLRDAIAEVEARAPITIEVKRPDSTVIVKDAHFLMPRLLRLLAAGLHVYLWGPAGSGKTTAALQAAVTVFGKDGEIDTLDPSTPKSAIMGYRTPTGEPVGTAFSRCWQDGRAYIGDECDNAPAYVQTLFNSALANHHAPLAWGSVPRSEGFAFIGTGNTPGRPTAAFPDRRPMSAAFADRLYFVHWPLDPAIECRAAGITPPSVPQRQGNTCTPAVWVTWVQRMREWAKTNAPTLMITPRASLAGLVALAAEETTLEVAHGLVFRGADDAMVSKALSAVPLP